MSSEEQKKDFGDLIVAINKMAEEKIKLEEENKKLNAELDELMELYRILQENINKIKEVFLNM